MPLSYNVGSGTYITSVDNVRTALAAHPSPDSVHGHPVLMKQPFRLGHPPGRLLQVELSAGNMSATLAICDDNLYVVGFRPPPGSGYELCEASKGPHQQQIIPGSTLLDCGVTYRDLVDGTTRKEVNRGRSRI
ncbi:protein synthesis inhibitor II-like [Lolium perenne]|uniref:protein synthesis inhibitor II-like n=1 Tax=Lolium perenne TaxID=4522 RepID=UPI0021F5AFB2|nr:protein synthesis inhibitor II-like [Lolium perenne]